MTEDGILIFAYPLLLQPVWELPGVRGVRPPSSCIQPLILSSMLTLGAADPAVLLA